jgi:branched-chain amino acid transport system ATP-binding protein
MEQTAVLRIDALSRHFGGIFAVEEVSFDVFPGETFGVIGPNGAGKTTLLNCVSGVARPNSGSVHFEGQRIDRLSSRRIASRGIARTFQIAETFRSFAVIDYVLLGRSTWRPAGLVGCALALPGTIRADREEVRAADELLERHGLKEFRNHSIRELAYGHQKVVDIVRALAAKPKLLLLDEPTSGSSSEERVHLREIMSDLRNEQITVVVVDHDISFISDTCSRAFAMASGRYLASGTPEEVLASPQVIESYLGGSVKDSAV